MANVASVVKSLQLAGERGNTLDALYVSEETIRKGRAPRPRNMKPSTVYEVKGVGIYAMVYDSSRKDLIKVKADGFETLTQGAPLEPATDGLVTVYPNHWSLRFAWPKRMPTNRAAQYVASGYWAYKPCQQILVDPNQD